MTKPVPAVPPPIRVAVMVVPKPSAVKPGRRVAGGNRESCGVPVCSVIAPVVALMVLVPAGCR